MKNIMLLVLTALIMAGCIDEDRGKQIEEAERLSGFNIIVIDSCEYLKMTNGYAGYFSHKGNCRFCKERRQKELEKLITELKER